MTILQKIIEHRADDIVAYNLSNFHFSPIQKDRPSLYETLRNTKQLQIISEIKRASPSKGDIAIDVEPVKQAALYENNGAACISVLTEPHFFKGSYADLHEVAKATSIPVLCKDFIVENIQIDIAKAAGASVILLIVAALPKEKLQLLFDYATSKTLEVLVEVHTKEELMIAMEIGAKIIGVNNRNLKTFDVSLVHTKAIAQYIDREDIVLISESGIVTTDDAMFVAESGAKAILVGETLMRTNNVSETMKSLQVPLLVGEK
jgi:indole-3-glycerol phosphate synthase